MSFVKTKISGIYKKELKNGDVSWYAKYRDPITKKSVRKKLGTKHKDSIKNEKEAVSKFNIFLEERKKYNSSEFINEQEYKNYLTLTQLFDIYFNNRVNLQKRKLKEQYSHLSEEEFTKSMVIKTKFKNQKTELHRFNKNVAPFDIAKINANKITKSDINKYIEVDLGSLSLSQKSKFNVISMIKTVFNHAIKYEIINMKNPFINVRFQNPKRQRERVLSEQELQKLLKAAKEQKHNINIYLSIYLAVLTGGRANTILNIRAKDINIENKYISLYNFKSSKQYRLRLSDEAVLWFKNKILPYYKPEEFIIRHFREGYRQDPPQPMAEISPKVYQLMDELFNQGLNKKNNSDRDKVVNFHTIRRSIATNLVKNGTSVYDVMIFLNHSNVEQTMKYLNFDSNELHHAVSNLMGNIFKDF